MNNEDEVVKRRSSRAEILGNEKFGERKYKAVAGGKKSADFLVTGEGLDTDTYKYKLVPTDKVEEMEQRDYQVVHDSSGKRVETINRKTSSDFNDTHAVLMRIPHEWYENDYKIEYVEPAANKLKSQDRGLETSVAPTQGKMTKTSLTIKNL